MGAPPLSEREAFVEALRVMARSQEAQNATLQAWLGMFSAQSAQSARGWTADDESRGIREEAKDRGIRLPDALASGTEAEKVEWLAKQMDEDVGW